MFKANNVQVRDAVSMEPPVSREELFHDAVELEFELLISDPDAIETAFAEGFQLDAIACELLAELSKVRAPSLYEAAAKRIETAVRKAIWEIAKTNVEGRE